MTFPYTPVHQTLPISPSLKYSNGFQIVFVSGGFIVSVFAALCWSRWWLCFLLRLRLAFFLLIVVLEEQKRKHAKDTADANTKGFTLKSAEREDVRE